VLNRTIYEKLGSAFSEEQQNFYQQKADEITPNIRYCAYNLDDGNVDINELMKMRFSSGTGAQDLLADKLDVRLSKFRVVFCQGSLREIVFI
jgi:hypothetical protein